MDYVAAVAGEDAFNCPSCGAYAHQLWHRTEIREMPWERIAESSPLLDAFEKLAVRAHALSDRDATEWTSVVPGVSFSKCGRCKNSAIWLRNRLLWPNGGLAPPPNQDLPEDVRRYYMEANEIARASPRAAAVLVRLAIEALCETLVPGKRDLNAAIRALVDKGLSRRTQMALDVVRVTGNNAAHPRRIDDGDDLPTAESLLLLVNLIAEEVISRTRTVDAMYDGLPARVRERIAEADGSDDTGESAKT